MDPANTICYDVNTDVDSARKDFDQIIKVNGGFASKIKVLGYTWPHRI